VIRGKVILVGKAPVIQETATATCHGQTHPVMDESVIVAADGGLKNVVITIEGIGPSVPRGEPPVLDQINCTYVPHVLGVTVGQELVIRSQDAEPHNVHLLADKNPAFNASMTTAGSERRVKFDQPEIMRVKCDVHPWMTAHVIVVENPFFAVTGDDGSFEIKNLPAGSYKLAAWHELFGRQEQSITLADDKPAEVSVTYGKQ
jgi:plastocyanin